MSHRRTNSLQMIWRRLTPMGWLIIALVVAAGVRLLQLAADLAASISE